MRPDRRAGRWRAMIPTDLSRIVRDIADTIARDAAVIEREADAKDTDATPGPFGIAVRTVEGTCHAAGATGIAFPIQSISKVFALELAMRAVGDDLFARVGREPSGDPFNSILDLQANDGIPRNPFVNPGALVIVDVLVEQLADDAQATAVVDFIAAQTGRDVPLDDDVIASEHEGGDLNRAMMSFMRHHGNLRSPIDEVMEAYVHQCAIRLDCRGLAKAGLFLTDTAFRPDDDAADADANGRARRMRRILALMTTCGNYDGSGDFAWRIGLPAKSGVGGGILAIVPGVASIAVFSPNLDQHGNSMLGVRALEMLADRADWSIFGAR